MDMNYCNLAFMSAPGWPEVLVILVVVLIFFGAKKIPEMAKGLGQGIKEFKKATRDVQKDMNRALNDADRETSYSQPHGAAESPLPKEESRLSSAPAASEKSE